MTENNNITVKNIEPEHAPSIARLHIKGIPTGFISSLGIKFVTALYGAIADSKHSFGFVIEENNRVIGFVAFTTDLNALYKSVILKSGFRFAILLAWKMLSWKKIKKVLETLFYPARIRKFELPKAELLSIVIQEQARSKGLATRLIQKGLAELAKRNIEKVKIFAGADLQPVNKLYQKLGANLVRQMSSHGVLTNIYILRTDIFNQK